MSDPPSCQKLSYSTRRSENDLLYWLLVGNKGIDIINGLYIGIVFPYSLLRTGKMV